MMLKSNASRATCMQHDQVVSVLPHFVMGGSKLGSDRECFLVPVNEG